MLSQAAKTGQLLAKNTRPQNIVYSGLLAAVTALILHSSIYKVISCYILVLLLYAIAAGYNNIQDLETDRLNKRLDNPLLHKEFKYKDLNIYFILCLLGTCLLQFFFTQPQTAIITLVYLILTIVYSHKKINFMSRGLLGTILLCAYYGSLPFLLGAVQGEGLSTSKLVEISLLEITLLLPLILAKDYKDYKGDKLSKKFTPLILYGVQAVRLTAYFAALLAVALYIWLAAKQNVNLIILIICPPFYLVLIYALHKTRGTLAKYYRNLLTMVLLLVTISLISRI